LKDALSRGRFLPLLLSGVLNHPSSCRYIQYYIQSILCDVVAYAGSLFASMMSTTMVSTVINLSIVVIVGLLYKLYI